MEKLKKNSNIFKYFDKSSNFMGFVGAFIVIEVNVPILILFFVENKIIVVGHKT